MQILVADNHPVVRKFMSDLITKRGHEIITAKDGLSTLQLLESYTPDVIFVDLVMPNIDGKKLCQVIRSRKDLHQCFIVILSGIAVEEGEKHSPEDLGADLILAKGPFDRLAWHVDYIIKHVEAGRLDHLQGETVGGNNLFARQITKELLASKKHNEMTSNNMSEGLVELTHDAKITYANPAAISIIGIAEENLLSTDFTKLFENETQARIRQKISGVGKAWEGPVLDEILELNNKVVSVKILPYSEDDPQEAPMYTLVVMLLDVTRQKQAERNLQEEKEKYKLERNFLDNIFENSPDAIAIVDEHGRFTRWNNNAAEMFGYDFEEMKGKKAFDFYTDSKAREKISNLLRKQGTVQNYEINFKGKDGSSIPCAVSMSLLYDEKKQKLGSLSILRDLSEWKITEDKLKYLSFHDALTGVYNRAYFEEEMERLGKSRHLPIGIIVCDINKLKRVNDTMGHQKGDELIQKAADILRQSFRASDIIARIGGDEFAVLLPRCSDEVIEACVERIKEVTKRSNSQKMEPNLSIAIGTATRSAPPVDTKALFKIADDNMYIEKAKQAQSKT
ncbi:MAG: diguanylate cyclase [Desulfobacterales bacterium]|nr:diguanylate cyclase [Desulfobacterales bacterium]